MTGKLIPFPRRGGGHQKPGQVAQVVVGSMIDLPLPFTAAWQAEHLPLIDAAMDLVRADDAEFTRRCRLMAAEDGPGLLAELSARLDRLAGHIGDVVQALRLTATRIRIIMATLPT